MPHPSPQRMAQQRSFVVIPARLESTRLPRKLLLCQTGKPLIQHTYEAALQATRPAGLCVACDHPAILEAVQAFGGRAVLTDPAAPAALIAWPKWPAAWRISQSSSMSRATNQKLPAVPSTWPFVCWRSIPRP